MGFLDVLAPDKETAHSRILAWLLDPRKDHGFGDAFLRRFATATKLGIDLKDVTVSLEPFMGESRGDVKLVSGKCYAVIENKVRIDACVRGQLGKHLLGTEARCSNRRPSVILIEPPETPGWLKAEVEADNRLRSITWRQLVLILSAVRRYSAPANPSRPFLDAYIRYVEKHVLKQWDEFEENRITKKGIQAAAAWGKHTLPMWEEFTRFLDAVEAQLPSRIRGKRERGDWDLGDQADESRVLIVGRGYLLDAKRSSGVYVCVYCSPKATARDDVWFDVEFSTNHPRLMARATGGQIDTSRVRNWFGSKTWFRLEENQWTCGKTIARLSALLSSPKRQQATVLHGSELLECYFDKFLKEMKRKA